ncbi:hypothetical protein [Demequina pelophila]|uniref:hypothetical protein n=1 Tax=Demequina pelophila TaxID=1638984 RepID=UPI000782CC96|nr:hypothetical protein [Demequina pelophila]
MNPIAQKYGAPGLAAVNLIPVEIAEQKTLRRVQTLSALAVVAAVGVAGAGYAWGMFEKNSSENARNEAAQAELAAVNARDAKIDIYEQVKAAEREEYALAQIDYGDIDYAQLTAAIQSAMDADTGVDQFQVVGPNASGDVLGEHESDVYGNGVGTVTITARATSFDTATALISRLDAIPGLANVRGTVEAYAGDGADTYYAVDATGVLTDTLLQQRFIPASAISGIGALTEPDEAVDAEQDSGEEG